MPWDESIPIKVACVLGLIVASPILLIGFGVAVAVDAGERAGKKIKNASCCKSTDVKGRQY